MKFEDSIYVKFDNRHGENPFLVASAQVEHSNGKKYSVNFMFEPFQIENIPTGKTVTEWSCRLQGASFKDSRMRRRFVSENHKTLRHDLFFVPHQLVRNHLMREGILK